MKTTRGLLSLLLGLLVLASGMNAARADHGRDDAAVLDAHRLAAREAGSLVVHVTGVSMRPYFDNGAVLVVRATEIDRIRPGMVVVYRNRFGEVVVHRAERLTEAGWVMRGYNNREVDSTPVNAANLVGTVYTTLAPTGRTASAELLAGLDRTAEMVALAAPAR